MGRRELEDQAAGDRMKSGGKTHLGRCMPSMTSEPEVKVKIGLEASSTN